MPPVYHWCIPMPIDPRTLTLRLRPVLDSARAAVVVLETSGEVIMANAAAIDLFPGADGIVGRPFWDAAWWGASTENHQRVRAAVEFAATGRRGGVVLDIRSSAGDRTIDLAVSPVR